MLPSKKLTISMAAARARRQGEQVEAADLEAERTEAARIADIEELQRILVVGQSKGAEKLLGHFAWSDKIPTNGDGWRRELVTPWVTLHRQYEDDNIIQVRLASETELHDMEDGLLTRTHGRFFPGGRHSICWLDMRLVDPDDESITSEVDEGVVLFGDHKKEPFIASRLNGDALAPVTPSSIDWEELDGILNTIELSVNSQPVRANA